MKIDKNYFISRLYCPKCGQVMFVPRKKNKKRPKNHIKDLYCCNCRRVMKFIEKGN